MEQSQYLIDTNAVIDYLSQKLPKLPDAIIAATALVYDLICELRIEIRFLIEPTLGFRITSLFLPRVYTVRLSSRRSPR